MTFPCAKFCNSHEISSDDLTIKKHNSFQIEGFAKANLGHLVSRWLLSCPSGPLCIFIVISVTKFCTRGGSVVLFAYIPYRRLSELEQETDTLRKRLMTEESQSATIEPVQTQRHDHSSAPSLPEASTARHCHVSIAGSPFRHTGSAPLVTPSYATNNATLNSQALLTTTPRTLDGVVVSAGDINGIFELYFREYSHFLPVLDSKPSPDLCYQQSPLLFWTIVGVACRGYSKNPTLLNALTKGITTSALLSVTTTGSPLQRIQAFLLLVTWPLPDAIESNQQEINYVLAGLLLHLAQRSGLHVPAGSDEFFRAKMPNLPDIGIVSRSELFAQIVLTYQRFGRCISLI